MRFLIALLFGISPAFADYEIIENDNETSVCVSYDDIDLIDRISTEINAELEFAGFSRTGGIEEMINYTNGSRTLSIVSDTFSICVNYGEQVYPQLPAMFIGELERQRSQTE